MSKLLQLSTYGLKNIEKPITLNFSNQTISGGASKVNNVKGIYGYNGAGKTALINSVFFYKNIASDLEFLFQNEIKRQLNDLINKKLNKFTLFTIFDLGDGACLKHEIVIEKNENGLIKISKEIISSLKGRTFNERSDTLIERDGNKITYGPELKQTYVTLLGETEESNASILPIYVNKVLNHLSSKKDSNVKLTHIDSLLFKLFLAISSIEVCSLKSDDYSNRCFSKEQILSLLNKKEQIENQLSDSLVYNIDDIVISENELESFKVLNEGLIRFLKIFKPELVDIRLELKPNNHKYHISRIFVYEDYEVEFLYESSGIKQLTSLHAYLQKCSDGAVVFIDEMDANINAVYFKKLVSYFANFAKGQLVFTTHNLESMDALKNQRRAINAIGYEGYLDTWVGVGNRSPIKDYMGGYFVHSPMNVEDFDFISVFEGE